jgi:hypothetical protein
MYPTGIIFEDEPESVCVDQMIILILAFRGLPELFPGWNAVVRAYLCCAIRPVLMLPVI